MTDKLKYIVVGTWPFSRPCVSLGMECLRNNQTPATAVERGINVAETDASFGSYHVGCGGWQNEAGRLELDAAIMDGRRLDFGAVTALHGCKPAISVARKVMESSRHSMLTGAGASRFAAEQGFECFDSLGTPFIKRQPDPQKESMATGHDTLGLLALDLDNQELCAGVSSSGMAAKFPGRVGDSALPGCGLYADSQAGAACCSGDGDHIMKYCPCYRVVQRMKEGCSPQSACEQTIREILDRLGSRTCFELGVIAVDKQGNHGAANMGISVWEDPVNKTSYQGFPYIVFTNCMDKPETICVPSLKTPLH